MENTYLFGNRCIRDSDPTFSLALATHYYSPERPRCMCVPGGVEMYVAKHRDFIIKRMPGTGPRHHPSCDSFEPDEACSGRGALTGGAIVQDDSDMFDVRVDFPLARVGGRSAPAISKGGTSADVRVPLRRISLFGLLQFLFEQSRFNRWFPAMAGRRHQGVIQKYLTEAASTVRVQGRPLCERLYVPEPFNEDAKPEIIARRRDCLAFLRTEAHDRGFPLAIVIGDFKDVVTGGGEVRIRIRHMADAPLKIETKGWRQIERKFGWMFDVASSEVGAEVKIVMCLLVYASQEHVLCVDAATCMLTTRNWIPLDAAYEVDVATRLTADGRRFIKPLRYDATPGQAFPNFLLLDTGPKPSPMYILSGFMSKEAYRAKALAIDRAGEGAWSWRTDEPMPTLPPVANTRFV